MGNTTNNNMAPRERITGPSPEQRTITSTTAPDRSDKARTRRTNSMNTDAREGHVTPGPGDQYCTRNGGSSSQPTTRSPAKALHQRISEDFEAILTDQGGGMAVFAAFQNASDDPPITPDSLTELDMPRIINNPKLRHDVNFDRELHFRPNLDGARGKQKMQCADKYWKALEGELFMLNLVQKSWSQPSQSTFPGYWEGLMKASRKRLPKIFEVVRDILKTLVPDVDQPKIVERLDVDLLIQQIDNGVCDLVDLADWLAKVLKNHCAPMRDTMVDKMQNSITTGAREANQELMVDGLRQLLSILEAMKLDVANHQIRHMRPLLIADTVNFQQRYNDHRINLGKLDANASREWLQKAHDDLCDTEGTGLDYLESLTIAVLRDLIFAPCTACLTSTFYLDIDRLRAIRVDMHNAIYQQICADIMVELMISNATTELPKALKSLHHSLAAIVGTQGRWQDHRENIAAEIMRIVLTLEGRARTYDAGIIILADQKLRDQLSSDSSAFCEHAQEMEERLLPRMKDSINSHRRLPAIDLQEALVAPLPSAAAQSAPFGYGAVLEPAGITRASDPDTDLVRRFTHVVVLHWQVWGELVYLAPPDSDSEHETVLPVSPSPSVSPEPRARAVFDQGHKFLPNSIVDESELPQPTPSPAFNTQPVGPAGFHKGHESRTQLTVTETEQPMSDSPPPDSEAELKENEQQDSNGAAPYLPSDRGH